MPRPGPDIINYIDTDNDRVEILNINEIWAVTYQGVPVGLRRQSMTAYGVIYKYPKCQFPTRAMAANTAQRLNTQFNTNNFCVVNLLNTESIPPKAVDPTDTGPVNLLRLSQVNIEEVN